MNTQRRRRPPTLCSLAVLIAVSLAAVGCGSSASNSGSGGSGTSSSGQSGSSSAKKVHLGFIYATTASNFAQEMALGAEAAAAHTPGVSLTQAAPSTADETQEVPLFLSATHTATDGLAMETLAPQLFVRAINQANAAHIPQISVDTPAPKGATTDLFIGNSNTELGEMLANAMLPKIPKNASGQILVGTDSPALIVLQLRNKGFESVIKKARPGISFVNFDSQQSPTANYNTWNGEVKAHPDAIAYVGPGSQDAVSMAQIERQTDKHYLVGADDLDPIALNGVKQGYVDVLISPEHWLKGYLAIKLLAAHAQQGKPIPSGWWNPGAIVVTSKNVDTILARQQNNTTRYDYFKKEAAQELAHPSKYIKPLKDAN